MDETNDIEVDQSISKLKDNQVATDVQYSSENDPAKDAIGEVIPRFEEKKKEIEKCLKKHSPSSKRLRKFAISEGGLLSDKLRITAWPKILNLTDLHSSPVPREDELMSHPDYHQVILDVNRSHKRFPTDISVEHRTELQHQLTRLILRVVLAHPFLRYYQGYNDVAVTLLLVTGEDIAFYILEYLSLNHLRDCMEATMDKTQYLLNYIYPLLRIENLALYEHMEKSGLGTLFALPWFLTWFGYSVRRYEDIVRLYDYFIASEPLVPLYFSAVLVIYRADEVLAEPCDMPAIHSLLSKIPDDLPIESLIKKTDCLYEKWPPHKIESEVSNRVEEEKRLRQMELAIRQRKMAKNATLVWRWLNHIDPVRRFPLWIFHNPQLIPNNHLRRYRYLMATAVAFGVCAFFMRGIEP